MLVTISLLQLATTLAKNITIEVNALIDKGNALGNLGNHTGAIQYFEGNFI
jgi:hypothetical protein